MTIERSYYNNSIYDFCLDSEETILGRLCGSYEHKLLDLQRNCWVAQIRYLKHELQDIPGHVFFEFTIPRMGKRADNILIVGNTIYVLEFKVGEKDFRRSDIDQVVDYAVDLKNFHTGSHEARIMPVLIATEAISQEHDLDYSYENKVFNPVRIGKNGLRHLVEIVSKCQSHIINPMEWLNSQYRPTPTIIEAAKALYEGHRVEDISRSDASAINLSDTTDCINLIIDDSKRKHLKSICFVTGVPGSGKTLAGLNIAIQRHNIDENEHAVYLSGNGPLITVLREALARDEVARSHAVGERLSKKRLTPQG